MSKVISFRLDENNPRERLVLETIITHQLDGYSIRSIIVEAFLNQNDQSDESHQIIQDELNDTLFQFRQLLDQFGPRKGNQEAKSIKSEIDSQFLQFDHESGKTRNKTLKRGRSSFI